MTADALCSSRKGTFETATKLVSQSKQWSGNQIGGLYVRDPAHLKRLQAASKSTNNKQLQQLIPSAVAIHHSGMEPSDRALVESLFLNQDILVWMIESNILWCTEQYDVDVVSDDS